MLIIHIHPVAGTDPYIAFWSLKDCGNRISTQPGTFISGIAKICELRSIKSAKARFGTKPEVIVLIPECAIDMIMDQALIRSLGFKRIRIDLAPN